MKNNDYYLNTQRERKNRGRCSEYLLKNRKDNMAIIGRINASQFDDHTRMFKILPLGPESVKVRSRSIKD